MLQKINVLINQCRKYVYKYKLNLFVLLSKKGVTSNLYKKYVFIARFQTGLTSAILNFLLMTQFTGIHDKVTEMLLLPINSTSSQSRLYPILLHIGILKNYCFSPLVNNHNLYNITTSINHFTKQPSFEGFIFHTFLKGKYLPLPMPTTTLSVRFVK